MIAPIQAQQTQRSESQRANRAVQSQEQTHEIVSIDEMIIGSAFGVGVLLTLAPAIEVGTLASLFKDGGYMPKQRLLFAQMSNLKMI
jgi:hypothetical protein